MAVFRPEHAQARSMIRRWCACELAPNVEALETGQVLPYDLIRKLAEDFDLRSRAEEIVASARCRQRGEALAQDEAGQKARREERLNQSILMSLVSWELCRVNPGFCFAFGASVGLAGGAILARGRPEQLIEYAAPLHSFEKIGAWALTEPDAGSDALGSMGTRAQLEGDQWVIRGQKRFITNAPFADIFVVYARFEVAPGRETVGAFIVERDDPGVVTGKPLKKMGLHASPTGDLFLDDVRIPASRILGEPEQSRKGEVVQRLAIERAAMVPMCLGIMERCIEVSVAYAKSRAQFGRPIADFQLIQAKLARMQVAFENGVGLFERIMQGMSSDSLSLTLACAAKLYLAEETTRVALDAVQILGGNGYMQEYLVEMFARDAKLFEIGGGTNEIQLLTIAREMLKEG